MSEPEGVPAPPDRSPAQPTQEASGQKPTGLVTAAARRLRHEQIKVEIEEEKLKLRQVRRQEAEQRLEQRGAEHVRRMARETSEQDFADQWRGRYARWAAWAVVVWYTAVVALVCLNRFLDLGTAVLCMLLGSASVNALSVMLIVTRYLFPPGRPAGGKPRRRQPPRKPRPKR